MPIIPPEKLENIKNHHFDFHPTPLEKYLDSYFERVCKLLPVWISPNVVTLAGFFSMWSAFFLVMYYDLTLSQELPWYVYCYCLVAFHFYQTCDWIDGKQARRTKSASPVGQIMDNGLDSLMATIIIFYIWLITRYGNEKMIFIVLLLFYGTVFSEIWLEWHTGVHIYQATALGWSEFEFLVQFLIILTMIFGVDLWTFELFAIPESIQPYFPYPAISIRFILGTVFIYIGFTTMMKFIMGGLQKSTSYLNSLLKFFPVLLLFICAIILSQSSFFYSYPLPSILAMGLVFYRLDIQLLVSRIAKMDFCILQLTPFLLLGIAYSSTLTSYFSSISLLEDLVTFLNISGETFIYLLVLGLLILINLIYTLRIIHEITSYLHISFLRVSKQSTKDQ